MEYVEYEECVLIGVSSAPCSRQYFSSIFTFLVIDLRETSEHAISATSRWIILYLVIYTRFTLYEITNNYEEHSGHSGRFILFYYFFFFGIQEATLSPLLLSDPRTLARQQTLRATRKAPSLKTVKKSNKRARRARRLAQWAARWIICGKKNDYRKITSNINNITMYIECQFW